MTSTLRRKRRITVRSTPPATAPNASDRHATDIGLDVKHLGPSRSSNSRKWAALPTLVAIACGAIVSAWSQQATAERAVVEQATYSTGQNGGKLQWLPHRPGKNYSGRTVARTVERPATVARSEVGREDPFAHRGGKIGSLAQLRNDRRTLSREPSPEPATTDSRYADPLTQPSTSRPNTLPPLGDLQAEPTPEPPAEDPLQRRGEPSFEDPLQRSGEPSFEETPGQEPPLVEEPIIEDPRDRQPVDPSYATPDDITLDPEQSRDRREIIDIDCPSPDDLDPIDKLTTDISITPGPEPKECTLGEKIFEPRTWAPSVFTWKASGLCHKPLYFEDVHLERYGHSHGPLLQPIISGGRFFLTIPALPYLMGVEPPAECLYTLGYYRPGDCAPYMLDPIPLSVRGALFQAGAVTGMVAIVP